MKKVLALVLAMVMVLSFAACGSKEAGGNDAPSTKPVKMTFGTGGESGTYYAYGTVLAQYVSNKTNLDITAVSSGGSKANIEDLAGGDIQLGFSQSDTMDYAFRGTNGFDKKVDGFSVVCALYM
ncbi:MAG: C4-dicarboxylate ABC transporter substrate-binding protein, partial [Clostridia bacterium]|nr:C4-dicarboxylate ABC transporter substrate-binding protein [Clostridia bacterium]